MSLYEWDPGNPWKVVSDGSAMRIVENRVDETEAYERLVHKKKGRFVEGDAVVALQGVLPLFGTVVAIKEEGFVDVKDTGTGLVSRAHESDLESAESPQLTNLFVLPS